MYIAGVDTVSTTIHRGSATNNPPKQTSAAVTNFIANMMLYPEVQRKVQAELDEVVGRGRTPTMRDISEGNLVYLRATWNESLRKTPPAPVCMSSLFMYHSTLKFMFSAVPHNSLREDNWKGYYLPKGTLILPNQG
jgi:hypothetical protein